MENQRGQPLGQSKDDMKMGDRQQFGLARGQPLGFGQGLTLRAMAIAAGVIGNRLVTAMVTLIPMTAQCRRAADLDGPQGAPLHARQRSSAGLEKGGAVLTDNVGNFQNGSGHEGPGVQD